MWRGEVAVGHAPGQNAALPLHGAGLHPGVTGSLAAATQQALDRDEGFDLAAVLARHLARGVFVDARLPDVIKA